MIYTCTCSKEKEAAEKDRQGTEERREAERAVEVVAEAGGGEVRGEEGESDRSDVTRRKRVSRRRRKQPATE